MARLVFPDEGSRLVYSAQNDGQSLLSRKGRPVLVYTDAAATILADITDMSDVAISGSQLTVDANSLLPLFKGPSDGTDTLYVKVTGSPTVATLYARVDDRIDFIDSLQVVVTGPDYGAAVSSADNRAAIQAAIDDVAAAGGGDVLVPAGRFKAGKIRLKTRVRLRGVGWASILQAVDNLNDDLVVLDTTEVDQTAILDLQLDGNKANNASGRGIFLDNTGYSEPVLSDPHHLIENVLIFQTKGNGFECTSGCKELRCVNVVVSQCNGAGFVVGGSDSKFVACSAAASGTRGWDIQGGNNLFVACKAFYSGNVTAAQGDGFFLATTGRAVLDGCEAQDNFRHGFVLFSVSKCTLVGCIADSNDQGGVSGVGFRIDGATDNILAGCNAFNRGGLSWAQDYGIQFANSPARNTVSLRARDNTGGPILGSSDGNYVQINGSSGGQHQAPAFAASFTPDPDAGETISLTLTANITINNPTVGHPGQRMTFLFTQDSTGGRTVTFGSAFKRSGFVANATPNAPSAITFVYDGTSWHSVDRLPRPTIRRAAGLYKSFPTFATPSTTVETEGALRVFWEDIPEDVTIDRIGIEVTSAGSAGAVMRLGIYNDDGTGKAPATPLLDAGTVDATSTGNKEIVISQALPKGRYWFGAVCQGGATTRPTVRCTFTNFGAETVNNPTLMGPGYQQSSVSGALPSPFVVGAGVAGTVVRVFVRLV